MRTRRDCYRRRRSCAVRSRPLIVQQLEPRHLLSADSAGIAAVNHPPVANDDHYDALEDMDLVIPLTSLCSNDFDADGNTLIRDAYTQPLHGTVSGGSEGIAYYPATHYHGPDRFTYRVADT